MPGFASFVYGLLVHRLPLLSLQQYAASITITPPSVAKELEALCWDLPPPVWPHSMKIRQRRVPDEDSKVGPAITVTYYDYGLGANLIQITPVGAEDQVLWDLELDTGHSFYFTPSTKSCKPVDFPVGIVRPNWLEGATSLGASKSWDAVCGWTKVDFIDYFADANTLVPDSWYFHTMKASFQVLNYTEDPTVDPSLFVPPAYCKHG
jgi:hypothetical protein